MSYRYRLPILSEQVLSEIIYGMENQDTDYMLDIRTGTLFNPHGSDVVSTSADDLVSLPTWTSAEGYELMTAFTNACKDKKLQERLASELNSRQKGVFRRFRDVLAEDKENLNQWYEFKERRMKSYIRSWYRDLFSRGIDGLEEGDDAVEGELLSDFEVCHLETLDDYCSSLLATAFEGNPVKKKIFDAFCSKEAFVVKKDGSPCGAIIYETVGDQVCILYYQVDVKFREMGLFSLMFDLFNREMNRKGIKKAVMPVSQQSGFIKQSVSGHEVGLDMLEEAYIYKVENWTENVGSSEYAYVL